MFSFGVLIQRALASQPKCILFSCLYVIQREIRAIPNVKSGSTGCFHGLDHDQGWIREWIRAFGTLNSGPRSGGRPCWRNLDQRRV